MVGGNDTQQSLVIPNAAPGAVEGQSQVAADHRYAGGADPSGGSVHIWPSLPLVNTAPLDEPTTPSFAAADIYIYA